MTGIPPIPGREQDDHADPDSDQGGGRFIRGSEKPVIGLRLSITGGGCSGFQYGIQLTAEKEEDDWEYDVEGIRVLIAPASHPLLAGVTVDFIETLTHTGFKFDKRWLAALDREAQRACRRQALALAALSAPR